VTLYIVATPIGNLADISARSRDAFSEASFVVAEDTRRTRTLLTHLGLTDKPLRRLDAHADDNAIERVAQELSAGAVVALATDAGTPGVSDPGAALVRRARELGVTVVPIPGPSAVTTALSASGYAFAAFRFIGFLPRGGSERARVLADVIACRDCVVLFEAPSRIGATLRELADRAPARRGMVARELTKKHEELVEAELPVLAERFSGEVLGEITLVLAPWEGEREEASDEDVVAAIERLLASGMRPREVAERVALETGRKKREVYDLVLSKKAPGR
jgi:16S rRNA (cytidine1402-2'-O)-methyltransferase